MLRERKSSRETAVLALAMNMQMSTPAHEPIQEAATTIEARSDPPKSTDIGYTSNQKLLNPPRPPKMNTVAVDNGMEDTSAKSPRSPSSVTPVSLTDTPRGEVVPFLAAGLGTGGAPQAISRRFSLRTMDLTPPKPQPLPQRLKEWTKNSFRGRAMGVVFPKIAIDPRQRQSKLEPYTLRHDTVQRQIWDAFIILLILLDIVITPFSLGFHVDFRGLDVFNAFVTVSFTMDFAINMFSSYVTERGTIASGPRNTIPKLLTEYWSNRRFPQLVSGRVLCERAQQRVPRHRQDHSTVQDPAVCFRSTLGSESGTLPAHEAIWHGVYHEPLPRVLLELGR
ncbi:hypothetical protein PINS_up016417 [Pythium insidiosum]|nr:hypothetical protein PINS_up016417 [Pythium insidiosum]